MDRRSRIILRSPRTVYLSIIDSMGRSFTRHQIETDDGCFRSLTAAIANRIVRRVNPRPSTTSCRPSGARPRPIAPATGEQLPSPSRSSPSRARSRTRHNLGFAPRSGSSLTTIARSRRIAQSAGGANPSAECNGGQRCVTAAEASPSGYCASDCRAPHRYWRGRCASSARDEPLLPPPLRGRHGLYASPGATYCRAWGPGARQVPSTDQPIGRRGEGRDLRQRRRRRLHLAPPPSRHPDRGRRAVGDARSGCHRGQTGRPFINLTRRQAASDNVHGHRGAAAGAAGSLPRLPTDKGVWPLPTLTAGHYPGRWPLRPRHYACVAFRRDSRHPRQQHQATRARPTAAADPSVPAPVSCALTCERRALTR